MRKPIIGQEAICPDGLGRVIEFNDKFPGQYIVVSTYINDRKCRWAPHDVELIDPRHPRTDIFPSEAIVTPTRDTEGRLTVTGFLIEACKVLHVPLDEIRSSSRRKHVAAARGAICILLYETFKLSLHEIADLLHRNHTMPLYYLTVVDTNKNPLLDECIAKIKKCLNL